MVVTHSLVSYPRVTSAISAIGGTTTTITKIIPVTVNGVHLVIEKTARTSQRLNDHWAQENSHHLLLLAVCVIDLFFGEDCYSYHLHRRSKNIPSICLTYKKCPDWRMPNL